ncbi:MULTISPECIES: hypothetical protein [unclassified Legionella]|uniref:hypothetical protein n=1 Tax=unclassified Legionella TaxID=2622702 RepID=UPI001056DFA1|nr:MULTISPECIES: hypothetical protein [unclassified Legionella]MDI9817555.1 hypothetical protein [Legionella sp. PL877]
MTSTLKHLMLKVAQLPKKDQQWVLKNLSIGQQTVFKRFGGEQLLMQARRFRHLKFKKAPPPASPPVLPAFCRLLATRTPLYVAIVLEQGQYPWQAHFLRTFDLDGGIKNCLDKQLPQLKPATKKALLSQWENTLSFELHLESGNG